MKHEREHYQEPDINLSKVTELSINVQVESL